MIRIRILINYFRTKELSQTLTVAFVLRYLIKSVVTLIVLFPI